MAYDEYTADRIRRIFKDNKVPFLEKRMMGGLAFMVDDKMCVCTSILKATDQSHLMARVGEVSYMEALSKPGADKFTVTGREMKGFVFVQPEGYEMDTDLEYWVQKCLDYNPLAKKSKSKRRSKE